MKKWVVVTVLAAAIALLAFLAAPLAQPAQANPAATPPAGNSPGQLGAFKTMDDVLMEVARLVPAFGGLFLNEGEETLYVYALPNADQAALQKAVAAVLGPDAIPARGIKVLPATYPMAQLFQWYLAIHQKLLPFEGVTAVDLQEALNRIWIGVETPSIQSRLEAEFARIGIPREAVVIEVTGPVMLSYHRLTNAIRPVDAGVLITNENTGSWCTYGFTAVRNSMLGMVTNSHCTRTLGSVDSDRFHQPVVNGTSYLVGTETVDPAYFNSSRDARCPANERCRYSDSAFVKSDNVLSLNKGYIARPDSVNTGSILIDHTYPRFRITSTGAALVGLSVNKVGQRTGWTSGAVTHTCVTVERHRDANVWDTLLCQYGTSYGHAQGDSGAPVFRLSNSSGDVQLLGLHHGQWRDPSGQVRAFYSPIGGVYADMGGSWSVCAPGYAC